MEEKIVLELALQGLKKVGKGLKLFAKGCYKVTKYTLKGCYEVTSETLRVVNKGMKKYDSLVHNTLNASTQNKPTNNAKDIKSNDRHSHTTYRVRENSNKHQDMDLF